MRRITYFGSMVGLTVGVVCSGAAPALAAPAAAAASQPAPAQDADDGPPRLIGGRGKKTRVGGYGSIGAAYTPFMGRESGLMSLEGAVLIDHRLSLGFAGYGFTRTPCGCRAGDGSATELGAGYTGFVARYSVFTSLPVYISLGMLVGGGATNLHRKGDTATEGEDDLWDDEEWDEGEFDTFAVVQPEATLHLNVTRWFRVGLNAGYRFTAGVNRFGLDESDLDGPVLGGSLQFGWF
jgi:hypothetical protein